MYIKNFCFHSVLYRYLLLRWRLAVDLEHCFPSLLWHCWLGHLIRKIVSDMTYKVKVKVKVHGLIWHLRWQVSRPQGAQTWITQFNLQTTPCLPLAFVFIHQMVPPRTVVTTSSCSLLLIYQPQKDERLSWPSWLTYSRRFTRISGHPSAVGWAQDSKSSLFKDQRSTAVPRNQPLMVSL